MMNDISLADWRVRLAWKPFLESDSGIYTYSSAAHYISKVAQYIKLTIVAEQEVVPMLLPNCSEFVLVLLGILAAGKIPYPIQPTCKPDEYRSKTRGMNEVQAAICHESSYEVISNDALKAISLEAIQAFVSANASDSDDVLDVIPGDAKLICATSGTTENPKRVVLQVGRMLQNAHAHAKSLGLNTDDRILSCLPFYHGMTLLTHIFSVLSLDATFVVGQDTFPQTISRMIKDFKVSYTSFVPSLLDVIICNFSYDLLDSEHLKKVSIGSAPVLAKQVRYYKEFFINQEVYVTYGQTEAGPRISTLAVNPVSEQLWDTVGLPLAGTEIRIANPDKDRVGELQVKSDWQMLGYYGEETDAGIWDEGWLRTGDLAKLTEQGYIRLCGRKKDLIISGGVNISPAEIEAVLNDIPWVVEAVVVPAPDKKRGEVPHAFVVRDGSGTKQEILSILRNRLDHLKVPKKIHFIDKMPRNAIGKTDRLSLRPYLNSPN